MLAKTLHHVSFNVDDLDASLHFYCDILGLERMSRPDFGIDGAWLKIGSAQVHLFVAPEGIDTGSPPKSPSPVANHAAFAVSDYGTTISLLENAGLKVIKTSPEVGQLWVADPTGNVIELTTQGSAD